MPHKALVFWACGSPASPLPCPLPLGAADGEGPSYFLSFPLTSTLSHLAPLPPSLLLTFPLQTQILAPLAISLYSPPENLGQSSSTHCLSELNAPIRIHLWTESLDPRMGPMWSMPNKYSLSESKIVCNLFKGRTKGQKKIVESCLFCFLLKEFLLKVVSFKNFCLIFILTSFRV